MKERHLKGRFCSKDGRDIHKIIPEFISGSSTQAVKKTTSVEDPETSSGIICFTITHGFTLIELLVVILIIGILAAIAVPKYQVAVVKARLTRVINLTRAIAQAEELFYLTNGTYTTSFEKLDIANANGNAYWYPGGYCSLTWETNAIMCNLQDLPGTIHYLRYFIHSTNQGTFCIVKTDANEWVHHVCKNVSANAPPVVRGVFTFYEVK